MSGPRIYYFSLYQVISGANRREMPCLLKVTADYPSRDSIVVMASLVTSKTKAETGVAISGAGFDDGVIEYRGSGRGGKSVDPIEHGEREVLIALGKAFGTTFETVLRDGGHDK